MIMTKYLTTNAEDLDLIENYTDATQTVDLGDGRFGFSDGCGGIWAECIVVLPGYDYVYGRVVASADFTNAWAYLDAHGPYPAGSRLEYVSKLN